MEILNLEEGWPSVEQARVQMRQGITVARQRGAEVLKVIHGYGSTGQGGDLRFALQASLRQMTKAGEIRDCIYGENWATSDERSWELLKRYPSLKRDHDLGRRNRGISIVLL